MHSRMVSVLLAVVLLIQSVALLAVVPTTSAMPEKSSAIASESAHDQDEDSTQHFCRGGSSAPAAQLMQCCDSMDATGCMLSCSAIISLVSVSQV